MKKPKLPSYLRRNISVGNDFHQEMKGNGLTLDSAFKERVLPFSIPNDYDRYLEPLHGKSGVDWSVIENVPIHTGRRHYFITLVAISIANGETKHYYFDQSANTKISYADQRISRNGII